MLEVGGTTLAVCVSLDGFPKKKKEFGFNDGMAGGNDENRVFTSLNKGLLNHTDIEII